MKNKATELLPQTRKRRLLLLAGCTLVFTYWMFFACSHRVSQKASFVYAPALPNGLDALWMLDSPHLPPFDTSTGRFDFGANYCPTDRVIIDVGAHKSAETTPPGFDTGSYSVLAFEPQLGFYTTLRDQGRCVFAVPAAVASENSLMEFHISKNQHSSSLLPTNKKGLDSLDHIDTAGSKWSGEVRESHSYSVFVVALKEVIPRLGVRRSPYLKVDAQGYDLEVVKSAGNWIRVFDYVKLEAKAAGVPGVYEGQPEPEVIEAYMKDHGFRLLKTVVACCLEVELEIDMHFVNDGYADAEVSPDCPMGAGCTPP